MPMPTQPQPGSCSPRPGITQELDIASGTDDRDLQDKLIRYLTDAKLRSIRTNSTLLDDSEAERATRFSNFLARRYYRDRLHRGFRYSAALLSPRQTAELLVEGPEFDSILAHCTLGSLDTTREVGQLAVARLVSQRQEEWWSELLDYELAFFIQLGTSESTLPSAVPRRNPSAILHRFQLRLPELVQRLRAWQSLADDLRGEVTLLFSRTNHGKIYVVETDERAIAVFQAIDDSKTQEEIVRACGLPASETRRILSTFSDIGTIVPAV